MRGATTHTGFQGCRLRPTRPRRALGAALLCRWNPVCVRRRDRPHPAHPRQAWRLLGHHNRKHSVSSWSENCVLCSAQLRAALPARRREETALLAVQPESDSRCELPTTSPTRPCLTLADLVLLCHCQEARLLAFLPAFAARRRTAMPLELTGIRVLSGSRLGGCAGMARLRWWSRSASRRSRPAGSFKSSWCCSSRIFRSCRTPRSRCAARRGQQPMSPVDVQHIHVGSGRWDHARGWRRRG